MQRLSDLNAINITKGITVTDNRLARVIFDDIEPIEPVNFIYDIVGNTTTVNPGIEIVEIVNYSVANTQFKIRVETYGSPPLSGSTCSWGNRLSWPQYLSLNQTLDENGNYSYIVSGLRSDIDWQYIRQFSWNLPSGWETSGKFVLICDIVYYDQASSSTKTVSWVVADPDHYYLCLMPAKATMACTARATKRAVVTAQTVASCSADIPFELEYFANPTEGAAPLYTMFEISGTNISVDWGDGSGPGPASDYTNGVISYQVPTTGYRRLKIYGTLTKFSTLRTSDYTALSPNANFAPITRILNWGLNRITLLCLANQQGLSSVPTFAPRNLNNLAYGFYNTGAIDAVMQQIANWNTSSVTTFRNCFAYSGNARVSGWNTVSATDMSYMFRGNGYFNQSLTKSGNIWYTGNVGNGFASPGDGMANMFYDATVFNQNLSSWNVDNINTKPGGFDTGATAWTLPRPVWGSTGS